MEPSFQFSPYFTKSGVGKLFRDPKPVPKHRYPRGYTPERMKEITEATSPGPGRWGIISTPEVTAEAREAIARSSVPSEHLSGLDNIEIPQVLPNKNFGLYQRGTRRGQSFSEVSVARSTTPPGRLGPTAKEMDEGTFYTPRRREEFESTLIHEIGHHASYTAEPETIILPTGMETTRQAYQDGRGVSGIEEARADDYRVRHYRQDPRAARRRPFDPETSTYEGRGIAGNLRGYYRETGPQTEPPPPPKRAHQEKMFHLFRGSEGEVFVNPEIR